jgi:hypothetical protein
MGVGLAVFTLAIAVYALCFRRLAGWRRAYTVSAISALYFNVFALVAQLFMKVPALRALAPTQQ